MSCVVVAQLRVVPVYLPTQTSQTSQIHLEGLWPCGGSVAVGWHGPRFANQRACLLCFPLPTSFIMRKTASGILRVPSISPEVMWVVSVMRETKGRGGVQPFWRPLFGSWLHLFSSICCPLWLGHDNLPNLGRGDWSGKDQASGWEKAFEKPASSTLPACFLYDWNILDHLRWGQRVSSNSTPNHLSRSDYEENKMVSGERGFIKVFIPLAFPAPFHSQPSRLCSKDMVGGPHPWVCPSPCQIGAF